MSREIEDWAEVGGESSKFNVQTSINRTCVIILLSFGQYMRILSDFGVVVDDMKRFRYIGGKF